MKIYIVRHGESFSNVQGKIISSTDLPLTEKGVKQAMALKTYLQKIIYPDVIHKAFSSPLMRARQTAAILCGPGMNVVESDDLLEMNLGRLEGLTWGDRTAKYPEINIESDLSNAVLPGGEKYNDVKRRCVHFIKSSLTREHMRKNILIVSHGITIRIFINTLLNKDDDCVNYINWPDNTAVSEIEWPSVNGAKIIRRLNERNHLVDAELEAAGFQTWGAFASVDYCSL